MFAAGKPVWYLPFAVLIVVFFLLIIVGLDYDRFVFTNNPTSHPKSLKNLLSTNTINAIKRDTKLHYTLLGVTESIARASSDIGDEYGFEGIKSFGTTLTENVIEFRKRNSISRRNNTLMDDLNRVMADLFSVSGVNTTGSPNDMIGNLGNIILNSLATPALFLGIGFGIGTSTGLNITNMTTAQAQAGRVASTFNTTAKGVNLAAQNIGSGLAEQLFSSLGQSGMMNISIGHAAYALASGIGNATAKALKLTNQEYRLSNDSNIEALAGNLGLGVSTPIISNIDFQAAMKSVRGGEISAALVRQLPQIAAAAGNGLGEGTKIGLGFKQISQTSRSLVERQTSTNPLQGMDILETVDQFTRGFSQSLLTNVDVGNLLRSLNLTGSLGSMIDPNTFPSLAAGAGSGIGVGLAIGFAFKPASTTSLIAQSSNVSIDDIQSAMVAEVFTQNLVSNFLLNSTVIQAVGKAISSNQPQLLKNADVAKAVEGFARGTIEGVSIALSSVGGFQNLISGNFSDDALKKVPVLDATKFNDSVNGSAVSFARGFMGEGTILIGDVLRDIKRKASNAETPPSQKRDISISAEEVAVVPHNVQAARQIRDSTGTATPFPLAINEATIMRGGQRAIDVLTCQGIGGIASVALGGMSSSESKTSMINMMASSVPLDPRVVKSLPQGPVEFSSEGNKFRIVLKNMEFSINGLPIIPLGVLTALHILFVTLAFLLTLPLYLILGVVWRLSVLAGYPVNEPNNKKWRLGLLITFGISAVTGIAIGMVGMGNSRHFRDGHGIVGIATLILVFPTVGFTIVRLRSEALYPLPGAFTGIKAPLALLKSPEQRIYIISGIFIQFVFALGQLEFINGFSTLRSISLCIVDAILTSNSVAGLLGLLLMVQITAAGMVGIRTWLEKHIAKRENSGVQHMIVVEAAAKTRRDSITTFGFGGIDSKTPPPFDFERPALVQRNTEELKGFEDQNISTPFNVRKEGADPTDFNNLRGSTQPSVGLRENPFLSEVELQDRNIRRTYDPKTAGYQYEHRPAIDNNTNYYDIPVGYQAQHPEARSDRPSLNLVEPVNSPLPPRMQIGKPGYGGSPPKMQGVTMADLFPPPPPPPMDEQVQLTRKSVSSSYSRPFDERGRPSSDAMRGFGSGPGDTLRARRYS